MVIGVVADTHDRVAGIDAALSIFQQRAVAMIVHCGDWKSVETLAYVADKASASSMVLYGVLGNRDDQGLLAAANREAPHPVNLPKDNELLHMTVEGCRIAAYHGHHKPTLRRLMSDEAIDVLMTGHSHKPLIQQAGHLLVINPGSTAFSIPRRREPRSVAIFDTQTRQAKLHFFDI
jgi:putative phosphoesterase